MVDHDIRKIAVEAIVDPRTVENYLQNKRCNRLTVCRIRAALERLDMREFIRDESEAA